MSSSSFCRTHGMLALLSCLVFAVPALALDYGPEAKFFVINSRGRVTRQKIGTDEKNPLIGDVTGKVNRKNMSVGNMTCEVADPKVSVKLGLPRGTLARYLMIRPRTGGLMALWGDLEVKTKESAATVSTYAFMEVKGYREVVRGKLKIERDRKNKPVKFLIVETDKENKTTGEYELEPRGKRDQALLEKAGDDANLEVVGMFKGYDENRAVQNAFANQEKSSRLVLLAYSITVKPDEPEKEDNPKDAAPKTKEENKEKGDAPKAKEDKKEAMAMEDNTENE